MHSNTNGKFLLYSIKCAKPKHEENVFFFFNFINKMSFSSLEVIHLVYSNQVMSQKYQGNDIFEWYFLF